MPVIYYALPAFFEDASYCNKILRNPFEMCQTFEDASEMIHLKGRAPNGHKSGRVGSTHMSANSERTKFTQVDFSVIITNCRYERYLKIAEADLVRCACFGTKVYTFGGHRPGQRTINTGKR